MTTRYIVAALLMTSSVAAFAQTHTATPARQMTGLRAGVALDQVVVAPQVVDATALPPTSGPIAQVQETGSTNAGQLATAAAASVPEPSSIALMAAGLFGAVGLRRRRGK